VAVWNVRKGLVGDLEEEFAVGQHVQVRVLGADADTGVLHLSMKPKADLSAFLDVPGSQWLQGVVTDAEEAVGLALAVPVPGGGQPQEGFVPAHAVPEGGAQVGQQVRVRIHRVNEEKDRLDLTMKADPPGVGLFEGVQPDEWFEGTVAKNLAFGMLVDMQVPDGGTAKGLVHISQIPEGADDFEEGEAVRVRVIEVDADASRLGLSMRPLA